MKISIVIPVYNEKSTIAEIIEKTSAAPLPEKCERELIVVDDCSTDGTLDILKKIKKNIAKVYHHKNNRGKGAALRTAYKKCSGDIIIIQDADLEYDPNEYIKLLMPIINGKADVVYGSRFMGGGPHRVVYYWHHIGNKMLTSLSNIFTDLNLTDMETCYKVFRRSIVEKIKLEENRFGIEPEFTAKVAALAKKEKLSVYEVGISYYGRTYDEGKKIGFKDAVNAAWCIWKYNSTPFAKLIKYAVYGILALICQMILMWILFGIFVVF